MGMQSEQLLFERQDALFQGELENAYHWVGRYVQQKHISGQGGGRILAVPLIETFPKGFPGDGARNEVSTRQRDMAIVPKYTLPVTNVLLEYFAATFPMLTPTEMTTVVMWCQGWGLDPRCQSTWRTKLGNSLFHHVNESGELGRFGLGNGSCGRCRGVCVIESKGEGHGTMQYKPRGIVDLLQGIWIIREMVRELELESVGDHGPKLLWEAVGEGLALFCSGDTIFRDQKSGHSDKLPVVLPQIGK